MTSPPHPVRSPFRLAAALAAASLLIGCHHDTFPQVPPGFREFAYVANLDSNTVTVLDVVNMRTDRTLEVGRAPLALAANPVLDEVYAVNSAPGEPAGSLSVLNSANNSVAATLRLGRNPVAIAVDPAGLRAFIANAGANSVSVVDLASRRVVATIPVGDAPGSLAVAPDGRSLVVANAGSGSVSVFATPVPTGKPATLPSGLALTLRATFAGCPGATAASILPDSSKAFIACAGAHSVLSLNLAAAPGTWAARQDATLLQDHVLAMLDVGQNPTDLTVKGDSGEVFVSNRGSASVSEIAATTNDVGSTYPIGDHPGAGLVSDDNSALWIADTGAASLSLYSIDDGKLLSSVHAGTRPVALAFAANGQLVLTANRGSNDVALIRTNSKLGPALFDMLPAGSSPVAILTKSNAKHP